jgi:hypothetical protein
MFSPSSFFKSDFYDERLFFKLGIPVIEEASIASLRLDSALDYYYDPIFRTKASFSELLLALLNEF